MNYEELINEVEDLFEQNRAKEAEELLVKCLADAQKLGNRADELQILNELIGYYRQTSEKDNLIKVMEASMAVADEMGLADTDGGRVPYATTALNVANGYRSIGDLTKSEEYYSLALDIYRKELGDNDMLLAGLYNNLSLLCQEKGDYESALDYQNKALDIVVSNDAGFEIAVTYANLANTAFLAATKLEDEAYYDKSKEYAAESIRRFEERGTIDAHYSAAIYAMGLCCFKQGDIEQARSLFRKGMDIVEGSVGRNSQYLRLKEGYDMCTEKDVVPIETDERVEEKMNGLKLSKQYFEQVGKPMLEEKFAEYLPHMAIGLVGEGSDCFGYDDEQSMDHDWGPGFCIWLPDDFDESVKERLNEEYDNLPEEFMGYTRKVTKAGSLRRGVMTVSRFYEQLIGTAGYEEIDWNTIKDYSLAAATNGEVWLDENGSFSELRTKLQAGYPEVIRFVRFANDLGIISQTGQYNYERMMCRGDRITADGMLSECIKQIMILTHHIYNVYPPHDKWLHKSFKNLCGATPLYGMVTVLHDSFRLDDDAALTLVKENMERVCSYLAQELYAMDVISDIESYLDYHTDELMRKASYAVDTDEKLVDRIARTEFAAFDKVKNEGGRASCQNDWLTFSVMRKSQYLTWDRTMLLQYLYDFNRELEFGHNLITEKYGRMMESTAPEKYAEIAGNFPEISDEKKAIIEQICALQMVMLEDFGQRHPKLADNTRSFHTYDDNFNNTSYETYLRGEISTYSDKMLQLYARHVITCVQNGINIAEETIKNTAKFYGYDSLEAFESV